MRTLFILLFALCLNPLWAQSKVDDVDNRKVKLSGEFENNIVKARFYDEIFALEWDYDITTLFTDSIRLSWPIPKDWRSPYRFMFEARPDMWEVDISRQMGNPPDRPAKYFAGLQYLNESLDARLMHPLIYMVEGKRLRPYFELRYLHIDTICDVDVFARGWTDLDQYNLSLGASKEFGSITTKILWNDFSSFGWSVGYSTVIN